MPSAGPRIGATKVAAPAGSGGRARTRPANPAGGKHSSLSLSDQVLAVATGKTQQEIAAACKGARPNHVGAAISRHKRRPCRRAGWKALRHDRNGTKRRGLTNEKEPGPTPIGAW